MAGESVAYFAAKAVLDNKQFISASRETSSRARELAKDFKALDRQAKADAANRRENTSVEQAISWGKAVYAIHAAEKALRGFNDALEMSGSMTDRLKTMLESLPITGGLNREAGRLADRITGALLGPSEKEMWTELDRLRQNNAAKADTLAGQERRREARAAQPAKELRDRMAAEAKRAKNVDELLDRQQAAADAVLYTEKEREAAADRAVLAEAKRLGATQDELRLIREQLKLQHEREAVVKRIDDTTANMAAVTQEMRQAEAKRRDEYSYMLDVQREITAEKKKQLDRERELAEAGKRSIAAMEAGTSAAYSAVVRGGGRSGLMGRGVEASLRQIAMSSSRTARNTYTNRVTTVDSF